MRAHACSSWQQVSTPPGYWLEGPDLLGLRRPAQTERARHGKAGCRCEVVLACASFPSPGHTFQLLARELKSDRWSAESRWQYRSWTEPFLRHDFKRWQKGGITLEAVDALAAEPKLAHVSATPMLMLIDPS